jgi:primosomal protein N' (replication factor Y)
MMFDYEIDKRRQFFYPPFSRVIEITLKHKRRELVEAAAYKLASALKTAAATIL